MKLDWIKEDQKLFLERGYLDEGETIEQRYKTICKTIEKICLEQSQNKESIKYCKGISKRFQKYIENNWVSFATPVLKNFGKKDNHLLPISCNFSILDDSLSSIYSHLSETALLTKAGAGVAVNFSNLRPEGSDISTGGKSNSIMDWIELYAKSMNSVNQNSSRRGQLTAYLSIDHPQIYEFLTIATLEMPKELMRFFNTITTAVTIPEGWRSDLKTNRKKKKLLSRVAEVRNEKGFPYILDLTNCNEYKHQCYKDKGMDLVTSNICCVSSGTKILTSEGFREIGPLSGTSVNIWNGKSFCDVDILHTGSNEDLYKVTLDTGQSLECTPNHKFYGYSSHSFDKSGDKKTVKFKKNASELSVGDKLDKFELPVIQGRKSMKYAYTHGFYCGDGCRGPKGPLGSLIYLYGEKKKLVDQLDCRKKKVQSGVDRGSDTEIDYVSAGSGGRLKISMPLDMNQSKSFVPNAEYTIKDRLVWFSGLLDSDGTVVVNKKSKSESFQITSVNKKFLTDVQLMLQTLGIQAGIRHSRNSGRYLLPANDGTGSLKKYDCKEVFRLLVTPMDLYKLKKLGLKTHRLKFVGNKPNRSCRAFSKVVSVEKLPGKHETFCFTEPEEGKGIFNGMLTGQCEVTEYCDEEKTFACCLSSVNLYWYDDWKDHPNFIKDMSIMLDCVIEEYIRKGKNVPEISRAIKFAEEHRATGLGTLAFHSYLQKKSIAFGSMQSYAINKEIYSKLDSETLKASRWMARYWGEPKILKGYGERATSRTAIAPTKSTSAIMGGETMCFSEGIQPITSNNTEYKLAKNQMTYRNNDLKQLLELKGQNTKKVWNSIKKNNGSVSHLDFLSDHEKNVFKTFFELSQYDVVKLAAQRQKFICMGQSLNVAIHPDTPMKEVIKLHITALNEGCKGLYYQYNMNASQKLSQDMLTCSACEG